MADAAIVIRWDRVVPGREKQGLSLFGQTLEYYGTLQSKGTIDSFEPVLFDPSGSDLNGVIILRGSAERLSALKREERFIDITMRGAHVCEGFGVVDGHLEGALHARMAKWSQIINE